MPDTETPNSQPSAKYRIWVTPAPFRKNGTPVLGSFGQSIRNVVIIELATWTRLCKENPELGRTQFEVGEL